MMWWANFLAHEMLRHNAISLSPDPNQDSNPNPSPNLTETPK